MNDNEFDDELPRNIRSTSAARVRKQSKPDEYLQQLQEKNRMKKNMEVKTKEELEAEERERGANRDDKEKKGQRRVNSAKKTNREKKGWSLAAPPSFILGAVGPVQVMIYLFYIRHILLHPYKVRRKIPGTDGQLSVGDHDEEIPEEGLQPPDQLTTDHHQDQSYEEDYESDSIEEIPEEVLTDQKRSGAVTDETTATAATSRRRHSNTDTIANIATNPPPQPLSKTPRGTAGLDGDSFRSGSHTEEPFGSRQNSNRIVKAVVRPPSAASRPGSRAGGEMLSLNSHRSGSYTNNPNYPDREGEYGDDTGDGETPQALARAIQRENSKIFDVSGSGGVGAGGRDLMNDSAQSNDSYSRSREDRFRIKTPRITQPSTSLPSPALSSQRSEATITSSTAIPPSSSSASSASGRERIPVAANQKSDRLPNSGNQPLVGLRGEGKVDSLEENNNRTSAEDGGGDLSNVLALRLAALGQQQQALLLDMIQKLESSKDPPTDILSDLVASSAVSKAPSSPRLAPIPVPRKERSRASSDVSNESSSLESKTTDRPISAPADAVEEPIKAKESSGRQSTREALGDNNISSSEDSIPLVLRIRIHSSWGKSKTASLSMLRLRYIATDENIDLSQFKVKVLSGLLPLSHATDTVRNICYLFYQPPGTRRRSRPDNDIWKGPVDPSSPLEICIEGVVETKRKRDPLENIELWLFNGDLFQDPGNGPIPLAESVATRDLDVIVGSNCVWSGQLERPINSSKPSGLREKGISQPTVVISLSGSGATKPVPTLVKSTVGGNRIQLPSLSVDRDWVGGLGSEKKPTSDEKEGPSTSRSEKISMDSGDSYAKDGASRTTPRPIWLAEKKSSLEGPVLDSKVVTAFSDVTEGSMLQPGDSAKPSERAGSSQGSRRRRSQISVPDTLDEPMRGDSRNERTDSVAAAIKPINTSAKPVSLSKPPIPYAEDRTRATTSSRNIDFLPARSPSALDFVSTDALAAEELSLKKASPLAKPVVANASRRQQEPSSDHSGSSLLAAEGEIDLGRSLEAIRHADRFNRGRLGAAASKMFVSDIPVETLGGGTSHNVDVVRTGNSSDGEASSQGTADTGDGQVSMGDRKAQRAKRIGEVVGNVDNALANLAGVMSSISEKKQQKQIRKLAPLSSREGSEDGSGVETANQQRPVIAVPAEHSGFEKHRRNSLAVQQALNPSIREEEEDDMEDERDGRVSKSSGTDVSDGARIPQETGGTRAHTKPSEAAVPDGLDDIDDLLRRTEELEVPRAFFAKDSELESSVCEIPVQPSGRVLRIDVLSTWGDPFYVGLNGIDIFDSSGKCLILGQGVKTVDADPRDINVLPEYSDDPRVVTNLLNGINYTRDDFHVWLAPNGTTSSSQKEKLCAIITITLSEVTTLSMIRIWNYNKSRTHSYRGVRRCRVKLDNAEIFSGEVKIAPGELDSPDECSEVVLFTLDPDILARISKHDEEKGYQDKERTPLWISDVKNSAGISERPRTSEESIGKSPGTLPRKTRATSPELSYDDVTGHSQQIRPITSATRTDQSIGPVLSKIDSQQRYSSTKPKPNGPKGDISTGVTVGSSSRSLLPEKDLQTCSTLTLLIESTWGDMSYVGLTGIEVLLGASCIPITDLDATNLKCDPRDLSAIGFYDDHRVPNNLIDGINDTTDDRHMWLIPFTPGGRHSLTVDLGEPCKLAGIRLWNYNKSPEDALRGVKRISVYVDKRLLGKYLVRIAPGYDGVEFGQTILFKDIVDAASSRRGQSGIGSDNAVVGSQALRYITPAVRQDYETLLFPSAMLWKVIIASNWGDPYYVGLDSIQIFDQSGARIEVESRGRVTAVPHSLRDIQSTVNDTRVPENLVRDHTQDSNGQHSWLAALTVCMTHSEREQSGLRVMRKQRGYQKVRELYERAASTVAKMKIDEDMLEDLYMYSRQNEIYILFDKPTSVSMIRFFNYSKTPNRGVKEFSIEADGLLLYMGNLIPADREKEVYGGGQPVLFSNDAKLVRNEKDKINYCGTTEQDVLCINERQVIVRSKAMFEQPSSTTAGIKTDIQNRPTTGVVR